MDITKLRKIIREKVKNLFENYENKKIRAYKIEKKKRTGKEDLENEEWIDTHTSGNVFQKMVHRALKKYDLIERGVEKEEKKKIGHAFA